MKYFSKTGLNKGTIIFIHGNSLSSLCFNDIVNSESVPYTKIAVDLPGHGTNLEGFDEEDFSVKSYKKQLISFINKIDQDILLVGNSMGGHLAIEISDSIKRLKGIVICGTPPIKKPINFEEAFLPLPALQTFFVENPSDSEIEDVAKLTVFNPENAQQIITDFKRSNPKVRKAAATDLAANNWLDQFQLFTTLNIAKYIIIGKNDPIVNPNYLEEVLDQCDGDCEMLYFNDCGHYPSIEKPEEFNQAIKYIAQKIF